MEDTIEASPWHREKNVAVHTQMAMACAKQFMPEDVSDRHYVLTLLSVLFHDTGKPPMEVMKENAERGVYRSYANHEQRSARIFEGYVVDNWTDFEGFLTPEDVYTVTWIIEHHLPYGLKQKEKVDTLVRSLLGLPNEEDVAIFFNSLRGDAYGRDSDNWDVNTANMEVWIAEYQALLATSTYCPKKVPTDEHKGHLLMLVGPAGAGKSTVRDQLGTNYETYSLDDLRMQFLQELVPGETYANLDAKYRRAFQLATDNETKFREYTQKALIELFKRSTHVIIDNTNTSAKSRRQYLELAKQRKMWTTAAYFPSSLSLLEERNELRKTKGEKTIPYSSLENMFYSVALPARGGEFDEIVRINTNYIE